MKKKYIQLGAVALVLLVLVGAFLLLSREPLAPEAEYEAPAASDVIYGEIVNPRQIDIHNEYGDIIIDNLAQDGTSTSELTIRGWESLSLDDYGLGQAISNAQTMYAKEIISESATAEELVTFGLENPRASLTVHFQNDTPVILFGDNAPGGEGVYVKLKNENKIYLISDSTALPYFKPATAYVNKTITATDPDYSGFNKITLSGANYPEPIVIEATPENTIETAGVVLHTHAITSPVKRELDTQFGLEPLLSIYGLLANDVVAVDDSPEVLEKYGLANPAVVLEAVSDIPELTFTLKISDPDANGEVHLIRNGSKVIYELSPSALPFLSLSAFDMMNKMVVIPNIKNVSTVVFTTPDKKYEFVLKQEAEGNDLDVALNGTDLPDVIDADGKTVKGGENFRKLYQTMIVARYDEPIPQDEQRENIPTGMFPETDYDASDYYIDPPIASIEYIYNTGAKSDIVSFYEGPPRKMEIMFNGEGGYYGQSTYLDRLLEDVEKVANNIAVKSYL